jgi:hypothetical protein
LARTRRSSGRAQVGRGGADLLRSAATLDLPPLGHLAAPRASALPGAGRHNLADVPGCRGGRLIVSPTPYGTCADIAGIANVCHARGKPSIVDEAWGAHLPFHDDLPTRAMDAGADVCVVSVHKMGAGFEQGSGVPRPGRSDRRAASRGVRGPADDDQPKRHDLRRAGRLAAADGRERREPPRRRP